MFLAGASLAWNANDFDESKLVPVLSRDVFEDSTGRIADAAFKLGFAHQKLGVKAANETPLGTVIAAPKPEERELFCRNGLKWFAKIPAGKIRATLKEIEKRRAVLRNSACRPGRHAPVYNTPDRKSALHTRTGFGGAHGGAVVPVHAVAASDGGGKQIGSETPGANRHPRIEKVGKGFQRALALAEQSHAKTLLGISAVADG